MNKLKKNLHLFGYPHHNLFFNWILIYNYLIMFNIIDSISWSAKILCNNHSQ